MDFYLVSKLVTYLLKSEQRVSFRTLRHGLDLDDETLAALRDELVDVQKVAADEGGKVLVWIGDDGTADTHDVPAAPELISSSSRDPLGAPPSAAEPVQQADAERRQLTVMFCDLVGSTALSTKFDPEDLREVITAFQDRCRRAIEQYEGFIARYMGDGMLVYYGYPQAHEDDAERAVRTGLDIVESMTGLSTEVGEGFGVELAVRVGVATGPVVVGDIVGDGAAEEAAVVGETPNLAARLQGVAEPNQVVVAQGTHRLLGGIFQVSRHRAPEASSGVRQRGQRRPEAREAGVGARGSESSAGRDRAAGCGDSFRADSRGSLSGPRSQCEAETRADP
jgi:class 3 adenylate cyclase